MPEWKWDIWMILMNQYHRGHHIWFCKIFLALFIAGAAELLSLYHFTPYTLYTRAGMFVNRHVWWENQQEVRACVERNLLNVLVGLRSWLALTSQFFISRLTSLSCDVIPRLFQSANCTIKHFLRLSITRHQVSRATHTQSPTSRSVGQVRPVVDSTMRTTFTGMSGRIWLPTALTPQISPACVGRPLYLKSCLISAEVTVITWPVWRVIVLHISQ